MNQKIQDLLVEVDRTIKMRSEMNRLFEERIEILRQRLIEMEVAQEL